MDSMSSFTAWMKHALPCGYSYWVWARSATLVLRFTNQLPLPEFLPTPYSW